MTRRLLIPSLLVLVLFGLAIWCYRQFLRPSSFPPKPRSVAKVIGHLGPSIDARLVPHFRRAGLSYPPRHLTLVAFKAEKQLAVFASDGSDAADAPRQVLSWPILAASGMAGPKLREGDRQVPEGFYRIELLNPNSRFHLSLRVDYPNADDILHAREDGRDLATLGGDIMIHGGAGSSGCLAIGDPAVEELFVLAARTGLDNLSLLILPCDFRDGRTLDLPANAPSWTSSRHESLRQALEKYPQVSDKEISP